MKRSKDFTLIELAVVLCVLTVITTLIVGCGAVKSLSGGGGYDPDPPGYARPPDMGGADLSFDYEEMTVNTPTGIITGLAKLDITVELETPPAGVQSRAIAPDEEGPYLWGYKRLTFLVPDLQPGENIIGLKITYPDSKMETKTIKIRYDPNMSLEGRQLIIASNRKFSVIYDFASGKPVSVLTDICRLVATAEEGIGIGSTYDGSDQLNLVKYDIYHRQVLETIGHVQDFEGLLDGVTVMYSPESQRRVLLNTRTGEKTEFELSSEDSPRLESVSPSGRYYVVWKYDNTSQGTYYIVKDRQDNSETEYYVLYKDNLAYSQTAINNNGDVIIAGYEWASGSVIFLHNGTMAITGKLEDLVGDTVFAGQYAFIGADSNPAFGQPKIYRFNCETGAMEGSANWPGSQLALTPQGNLIAATSRSAAHAYSFYYRAVVLSLPDLTRIGPEICPPKEVTDLSAVGL
ncbi:MAG: hypothetical protein Q7S37_03600 [bacterium]|nr:hypothetical protein [bacterium]